MKRPLAYITAPWSENEFENTENAAKYCRAVYDAGFSPVCPTLFLPLFLRDEIPQEHKDPIPADEVLRQVGLGERMQNFPAQLSGGEQQRVAIARALAKRPRLLLCDEPTGALDYQTGKQILALLQKQSRENGMTVVIITHNSALTAMADRVIRVRSGQITDVRQNEAPMPVESIEW